MSNEKIITQLLNDGNVVEVEKIIKEGFNVNSSIGVLNKKMIHIAVNNNDPKMVELLINAGADPSEQDFEGNTAFHLAGKNREDNTIKILMKSGKIKDYQAKNKVKANALINAIAFNNENVALELLNWAWDLEDRTYLDTTALLAAAGQLMPTLMRRLIELGARLDATNNFGANALITVCSEHDISDELGRDLLQLKRECFEICTNPENLKKYNCNTTTDSGDTALSRFMSRARTIEKDLIIKLLDLGVDPGKYSNSGVGKFRTPLMEASIRGWSDVAEKMIAQCPDLVNVINESKESALAYAIQSEYVSSEFGTPKNKKEMIHTLINGGANIAFITEDIVMACEAASMGDRDLMRLVKDRGLINQTNKNGYGLMHYMIQSRDSVRKNKFTLEDLVKNYGLNINMKNNDGINGLMYALLSPITKEKNKVLHSIMQSGHLNGSKEIENMKEEIRADLFLLTNELIELGLDIKEQSKSGRNVIHFALEMFDFLENILFDEDYIEFLIMKGASETVRDEKFQSPLMNALLLASGKNSEKFENLFKRWINKEENKESVRSLVYDLVWNVDDSETTMKILDKGLSLAIAAGADINFVDDDGQSPLIVAAASNKEFWARWLVKNGALVDHQNKEGETALVQSISSNSPSITGFLLKEAKANPSLKSIDGQSPYSIAIKTNRESCVNLVLEAIESWEKENGIKNTKISAI